MKYLCATRTEEFFNLAQVVMSNRLKHTQAKGLADWRTWTIKHRVGSSYLSPCSIAIWKGPGARFNKRNVSMSFCVLQSSSKGEICEGVNRVSHILFSASAYSSWSTFSGWEGDPVPAGFYFLHPPDS